jgi:hypothetical protein
MPFRKIGRALRPAERTAAERNRAPTFIAVKTYSVDLSNDSKQSLNPRSLRDFSFAIPSRIELVLGGLRQSFAG